MRHHAFTAVALGALMAASGCTVKIPPESIQVSRIVQSNLEDLQDKHVELVNAYFALRAEKFDEWFLASYMPAFEVDYETTWNNDHANDHFDFTKQSHRSVYLRDTIAEYEELSGLADQPRLDLLTALAEAYADVLAANEAVTTILLSAQSISKAQRNAWDATVGQVFPRFLSDEVDKRICDIQNSAITSVGGTAITCQ